MNYTDECHKRWEDETYFEHGALVQIDHRHLTAHGIPYETYMRAYPIHCVIGEVGRLYVRFPPEGAEDNKLHTHPRSDRVITILEGSGMFVAIRNDERVKHTIRPGNRVWMPRGILHTFYAGGDGLLVESIHNPWITLEDSTCLVYPDEA